MIVLDALVKCPHCGADHTISTRLDDDATEKTLAEPNRVVCDAGCGDEFVTRATVSVSLEVGVQKISWRKKANEKSKKT